MIDMDTQKEAKVEQESRKSVSILSNENLTLLRTLCMNESWQSVMQEETDVNIAFESFMDTLLHNMNVAAPLKNRKCCKKQKHP